jgi:hypothetical protein
MSANTQLITAAAKREQFAQARTESLQASRAFWMHKALQLANDSAYTEVRIVELEAALKWLIESVAIPSTACKERPAYEAARAALEKTKRTKHRLSRR